MDFYEISFPADIAYGATGGPEFFTDIVTSSSGYEQRSDNWFNARCRYNLASAIKTKEQIEQLIAFFRITKGRAIGFRFKDWSDYQLKKQEIAITDGITTRFQIIKSYEFSGFKYIRKIFKPISNSFKIYLDEKEVFPEIDAREGKIIFIDPPKQGQKIIIDGEFEVAVRFDSDHLLTSIEDYNVFTHQEIILVEIKL